MARLRTYNNRKKNQEWREFLRWLRPICKERGIVIVPIHEWKNINKGLTYKTPSPK